MRILSTEQGGDLSIKATLKLKQRLEIGGGVSLQRQEARWQLPNYILKYILKLEYPFKYYMPGLIRNAKLCGPLNDP